MTSIVLSVVLTLLSLVMGTIAYIYPVDVKSNIKSIPKSLFLIAGCFTLAIGVWLTIHTYQSNNDHNNFERRLEAKVNNCDTLNSKMVAALDSMNLQFNSSSGLLEKKINSISSQSPKEYIDKQEQNEINKAIENANSLNDQVAISASDFLHSYFKKKEFNGFALSEQQLKNLNNVFVNRPSSYMATSLLPLLLYKINPYATEYCKRILKDEVMTGGYDEDGSVGKYLAKTDIQPFIPSIIKGLQKDTLNNWRSILIPILTFSSNKNFSILVNSTEILAVVPKGEILLQNLGYLNNEKKQILENSLLGLNK